MITLAILKDEQVEGQRRAAGRMIRKVLIIGLDNYNLVIAEGSDPDNPVGKRFYGKLAHLSNGLARYGGIDVEQARKQMLVFFAEFSGASVGDLSWAQMDQRFKVGERCRDSSAKLKLYLDLKDKGWNDRTEDSTETGQAASTH